MRTQVIKQEEFTRYLEEVTGYRGESYTVQGRKLQDAGEKVTLYRGGSYKMQGRKLHGIKEQVTSSS